MDDQNWNKMCKLKVHERKLCNVCVSVLMVTLCCPQNSKWLWK